MAQTFTYKVLDRSGQMISGELEAESEALVTSRLRDMGYVIVDLAERVGSPSVGQTLNRFQKIKAKDVTVFSRQFATMINAGLPLLRALVILADQTPNKKLAGVINQLRQEVEAGTTLSASMAHHPLVFNDLYISMIQAGETGGVLDGVLLRVSTLLENEEVLKGKVKSAMMYPSVAFSFALIIVFVLVTFVVPTFATMFIALDAPLPLPTKILMGISNFFQNYLLHVVIGVSVSVYAFNRWKRTDKGKITMDKITIKLPVIGDIIKKAGIARFTRTFGTLVSSGVAIMHSLDIVGGTSGNYVISQAVTSAKTSVSEGESLAPPLAESGVFPPMVTSMIAIGEETGALDQMLEKIADFYDEEVSAAVDGLTSLIEPMMIIGLGSVVGAIIISLYLPIFTIINYVGG